VDERNVLIKERNAMRALDRLLNQATPDPAFLDSDDESVISVDAQANADGSPTKALLKALCTLPESEGADMLRAMNTLVAGSKRPRDDEKDTPFTKKPRVEIQLVHGMSAPVVFHQYLKDLYSHDIYIPLSFFTSPNLEYINSNASALELSKTNTPYSSKDQIKLLNVAALEKACYREEEMDRGQWLEACRNYVAFLGVTEGEDSAPQIRWDSHFAYFKKSENAKVNFPAILAADVALRKSYVTQPFVFAIDTYRHMLDKCINSMHLDQLRSEVLGTPRLQAEVPRGPPNSRARPPGSQDGGARGGGRGGRGGGRGRRGGARSGAPFKEATGGPPPPPFASYARGAGTASQNARTTRSPTDLRSTARPETRTSLRSGEVLCRAWNIKGPRTTCSHGGARIHACGFCSAKTHHGYAWACQQKPA
jgi:hypothetical protein